MNETADISENFIKDNYVELLRGVSFFDGFNMDELTIISKYINIFTVKKGEILFREGEKGDYICFVLDGCLDVIKKSENNSNVEITSVSKGRLIGEMSIVDHIPRSATIKARSKSKLASLSLEGFELILNDHPKIGVKVLKGLLRYLSENMRKTTKRFADSKEAVSHIFKLSAII